MSTALAKRTEEIQFFLDTYIKRWNSKRKESILLKDNAASDISRVHFIIRDFIAEHMEQGKRINKFKVCSATEFACFCCLPILHEDPFKRRELNALLAVELAMSLYLNITFNKISLDIAENKNTNIILRQLLSFVDSHIDWLTMSSIKEEDIISAPVLLNSQIWELLSIHFNEMYK